MGGRFADGKGCANGKGRPSMPEPEIDAIGALNELISISKSKSEVTLERFFSLVSLFAKEKRKEQESLKKTERFIRKAYDNLSPEKKVEFFSMLYDIFAERYDEHMGVATRHFQAIRRLLHYATPYLGFPMLDITAGTGEPLKYALEFSRERERLLSLGIHGLCDIPGWKGLPSGLLYPAYANEISPLMLDKARGKLGTRGDIGFTTNSAFELPEGFIGAFSTVLCSQTFHLLADEDKQRLVCSIHSALAQGGMAVVLEEDPFWVCQSEAIELVGMFIRSVARPVLPRTLIAYFETSGFAYLDEQASSEIDNNHSMRLHLFQKR